MESRERSKRRKRKAESIRGEEDFITVYGHHIMVYLICNYKDEIEQEKIKDVAKKKKNKKINNNNNNSLVHVLDEDDRGPPMPDQMARKIKEMMDMNDGKEDDNNNESFMKRRMVWLGQKKIEVTDTSTHHNRLFFPKGTTEKLTAFCSDEENRAIRVTENSKNKKDDDQGTEAGDAPGQGLYVQVVDGEGGVWEKAMLLKWWQSVKKTVFTREWNSYVKERRLKPEVLSLQLWCFRDAQNKLCFAVNVVPTATTPPNVASGNKDQSNADVANGSDNNGCDQTNNVSGASDQTNNLNGEEGGTPVLPLVFGTLIRRSLTGRGKTIGYAPLNKDGPVFDGRNGQPYSKSLPPNSYNRDCEKIYKCR
ncbi:hypothetical protein Sjap_009068 [Stephania japonica]|uniref:B3 domain-containing protein n=1 Tax=Stephania japonica TaxID=461633 RepID=A0AAP0PCZ2_9MAGN